MKAAWKAAIANWNTALVNTGLDVEVRLVKTRKWKDNQGSAASFLDRLVALSEDTKVAKLRERFRADIVGAALEDSEFSCSLGWINGTGDGGLQPEHSSNAFHVVAAGCLTGFGGLEVALAGGHNVGLGKQSPSFGGAYPFSRGYRVAGDFRTVVTDRCENSGLAECSVIPYFSTPLLAPDGTPLGIVDDSDNARSIDADRGTVEDWYACKKRCQTFAR